MQGNNFDQLFGMFENSKKQVLVDMYRRNQPFVIG
jgi:hypothetical protein